MFIGEYQHVLDGKKRVSMPSKFRVEFQEGLVITRGLDKSLAVYTKVQWEKLANKLSLMPSGEKSTRSFVRLILAGAVSSNLDAQGRILIPDYLKEYAGLEREVVFAGLFDKVELWDKHRWVEYKQKAEQNQDEVAEELGRMGIY